MEFNKSTRILVVAAHPDDEVLGCGGTLALAREMGAEISVLFLGEGISARFPFGQYESEEFKEQTEVRLRGAKNALKKLGISDASFGKRYCCQFDTIPQIELVKEIEAKMDSFRPTILLTHYHSEVNVDHRRTFEAVEAACRPNRATTPNEIYAFEIVCSGNWTFESSFKPNVFVDISKTWKTKMDAWHAYEGESRPFPFPRSDEGLETLARFRGMTAGLERAEAFKLLRKRVLGPK